MSLLTAMYSSASGLNATTDELSVVGQYFQQPNVGFKASRTDFADAMTQEMVGSGEQGLGVRTLTVQKLMAQGSFTTTIRTPTWPSKAMACSCSRSTAEAPALLHARRPVHHRQEWLYGQRGGLRVQGMQADTTATFCPALGDLQLQRFCARQGHRRHHVRGNLDSQPPRPRIL